MRWIFVLSLFPFSLSSQTYHFKQLISERYGGIYQNDSLSTFTIVITDSSVVCLTNRDKGGYIGDIYNESFIIISRNNNTIEARNKSNSLLFIISIDAKKLRIKTDSSIDQFEEYYFSN